MQIKASDTNKKSSPLVSWKDIKLSRCSFRKIIAQKIAKKIRVSIIAVSTQQRSGIDKVEILIKLRSKSSGWSFANAK